MPITKGENCQKFNHSNLYYRSKSFLYFLYFFFIDNGSHHKSIFSWASFYWRQCQISTTRLLPESIATPCLHLFLKYFFLKKANIMDCFVAKIHFLPSFYSPCDMRVYNQTYFGIFFSINLNWEFRSHIFHDFSIEFLK